jgi:hypothetical protein
MASVGIFGKSLKRLFRRVKRWKFGSFPFGEHVILYLTSKRHEPCSKWKFVMITMVEQRMTILMDEIGMD